MEIIDGSEILHEVRATADGNMRVVCHGMILEHFLLPVDVRIALSILNAVVIAILVNEVHRQHLAPRVRHKPELMLCRLIADSKGIGTMKGARQLAGVFQSGVHANLYLGLSFLTTLCSDKDDTIGTTDTINSCSTGILQNGDTLHGADVDAAHRTLDTINKDERVAIVPRGDTADNDFRVFLTRHTGRAHRHHARHITRQRSTDACHTAGTLQHLTRCLGDGTYYRFLLLLSITDDDDLVHYLVVIKERNVEIAFLSNLHLLREHAHIGELKR